MRQLITIFLCIFCQSIFATSIVLQDSLLRELGRCTTSNEKAGILQNLADIYYELPLEQDYLEQLVAVAQKAKDDKLLLRSLSSYADYLFRSTQSDSVQFIIDEIKSIRNSDPTAVDCQLLYLRMRLFTAEVAKGSESSIKAINQEVEKVTAKSQKNISLYEQIENAYIISDGLKIQEKFKEALPYAVSALDMADTLPFKDGFPIRQLIANGLKVLYMRNGLFCEATILMEKYISLQEDHYQQYIKRQRPFYPIESFRIASYTTLIMNIRHLSSQKANFYLQSIMDLTNKTNRPKDKYSCFLAINNYYLFKADYPKALAANDSLIEYAKVLAPYNVPGLYNVNSQIYEVMGQHKEALYALRTSHQLQDSLTNAKSMEQLNKLQVEYDLNKLNYEKSQLEIKNKQIMLISLSIVLLISIFVSVYLYRNLKQEKIMKARLRILKVKAEESENMKAAFINSICHEIRTPLNSIVGFTDLVFNDSIDEELRSTFPEEIQKNTKLLTGLVNSMLEVSNLDVSDEQLPCEPTDINVICQNEMDRIQIAGKPGISFQLKLPQESLILSTNAQYLSLVIENLLNNANKFTITGSITLEYSVDKAANCLQISVTDTGSGIPTNKHEEVFDRFTKLDSFIPGSGLGLYLCRLIIKRLSGKIAIDETYNKGTRVVISLPMQ